MPKKTGIVKGIGRGVKGNVRAPYDVDLPQKKGMLNGVCWTRGKKRVVLDGETWREGGDQKQNIEEKNKGW